MALIKLTAFVDQISGKLNGTVFSRNRGGAYVRSKSKPSNPQSSAQMAVRAAFGAISQLWGKLSQEAREAWNASVGNYPYINRLGDSKTLSGFALHQKLNRNLQIIGEDLVDLPPSPASPISVASLTATAEFNGTDEEWGMTLGGPYASEGADTSTKFVVYATPKLREGVGNFDNLLREIDVRSATVGDHLNLDVLDAYTAKFGVPEVGAKYGFKIVGISITSGQASVPMYADVIASERA